MHLPYDGSCSRLTAAQTPRVIPHNIYPDQMKVSVCRDSSIQGERINWLSLSRVSNISPVKTSIYTVRGENVRPSQVTLKRSSSPHTPKITIRYQSPSSNQYGKHYFKTNTNQNYQDRNIRSITPQKTITFKGTNHKHKSPQISNQLRLQRLQKTKPSESLISTKRSIEQSDDFDSPVKNLFGSATQLSESNLRYSKLTNRNDLTMAESIIDLHPFQNLQRR